MIKEYNQEQIYQILKNLGSDIKLVKQYNFKNSPYYCPEFTSWDYFGITCRNKKLEKIFHPLAIIEYITTDLLSTKRENYSELKSNTKIDDHNIYKARLVFYYNALNNSSIFDLSKIEGLENYCFSIMSVDGGWHDSYTFTKFSIEELKKLMDYYELTSDYPLADKYKRVFLKCFNKYYKTLAYDTKEDDNK